MTKAPALKLPVWLAILAGIALLTLLVAIWYIFQGLALLAEVVWRNHESWPTWLGLAIGALLFITVTAITLKMYVDVVNHMTHDENRKEDS